MTTRRDFLKSGVAAATGVVFCRCGTLHSANAQAPRQKLPVMVGGKRTGRIEGRGSAKSNLRSLTP